MLRRALTNAAAVRKELREAKTKLRHIHQGVTNDSLPHILKNAHPEVSVIDFSHNGIGPQGAAYIRDFLPDHSTVFSLNLSDNRLVTYTWELPRTKANTTLDMPSLADQSVRRKNDGIVALSSGIAALKSLEVLSLSKTGVDDENIVPLSISLNNTNTLRILDLSHNEITFSNMQHLIKALGRSASNIQVLDLGYNKLSDKDNPVVAAQFIEILSNLPCLTELRVAGNAFSLVFLKQILFDKNLTKLSIGDPKLGLDIVDLFEEYRSGFYHLLELDLGNNSLGDEVLQGLMFPFMDMKLRSLNLSNNNASAAALIGVICFQFDLVSLNLSFNKIDDNGAQPIADYLMCFRHLEELDMSENSFGPEGATIILDALEASGAPLKRINLGESIGEENQLRVLALLTKSPKASLTQPGVAAGSSPS